MADEYVVESIDKKGIAGQRKTFLQTLQESCKNKVSVGIRFHGPGGKKRERERERESSPKMKRRNKKKKEKERSCFDVI